MYVRHLRLSCIHKHSRLYTQRARGVDSLTRRMASYKPYMGHISCLATSRMGLPAGRGARGVLGPGPRREEGRCWPRDRFSVVPVSPQRASAFTRRCLVTPGATLSPFPCSTSPRRPADCQASGPLSPASAPRAAARPRLVSRVAFVVCCVHIAWPRMTRTWCSDAWQHQLMTNQAT